MPRRCISPAARRKAPDAGLRRPARCALLPAGPQRQAPADRDVSARDARSRPRLGAGGADQRARLPRRQARAAARLRRGQDRARAVPSLLRLCRRSRRDAVADLGDRSRCRAAADAGRGRGHAADRHQDADAGDPQALARLAGRHRPLGVAEAADRRAAGSASRRGWPSRRWPTSATSRSMPSRRSGTASRRPTGRCSTGCCTTRPGPAAMPAAPSCRRCWPIPSSAPSSTRSIRRTSAPNGNGTASACRSPRRAA